jgi:hypothetical protein
MDAEGATLPHDAVKELGSLLSDGIVFHEELLKLVDEQEGTRKWNGCCGGSVACEILNAELSKYFATMFEFIIDAFKDTECKLAVAFDGDDSGVWESMIGVTFKLDALFEVDEVEFNFAWTEMEGEIANEDVE